MGFLLTRLYFRRKCGICHDAVFCRHQGQQEISTRAAVTGNDGDKQEIILERNDLE